MCALFLGSKVVPDQENKKLHPTMVTKHVISTIIQFLLIHNPWYHVLGIQYSVVNTKALYDNFQAIEMESAVRQLLNCVTF
jgi:hypothetical protein